MSSKKLNNIQQIIYKPHILKKMTIKHLLSCLGLLGLTYVGQAQSRIYVNEYLNIGVGAKALAMGGAQAASSKDVYSAYYNPAGLAQIQDKFQVGAMHAEYFAGNAKYDYAAFAMPSRDKKRSIGISAMRFATDDIPYTIDYVKPDGSFDESKLKSISAGDYAFMLSYAQRVNILKDTSVQTFIGANAKMLYRNIGSMASAWGAGADIGVQALYQRWNFGLHLKDITTTYTNWTFNLSEKEKEVFAKTGNIIPVKSYEIMKPRLVWGAGYQFFVPEKKVHLWLEANADMTTDGKRNTLIKSNTLSIDPRFGAQLDYKNMLFLRAGVCNIQKVLDDKDSTNQKHYTLFQPSIGLGVKLGVLVVDYAYTSLQTQSNPLFSHIISIRLDFNPKSKTNQENTSVLGASTLD